VAQFADRSVSLSKFDAEIAAFTAMRADYERRGWFLIDATFPTVVVLLATPNLQPPAIVCGVLLDYTNYDAAPPSVRLVDPFTREPYRARELPTALNRSLPAQRLELPGLPEGGGLQMQAAQPLMQAHDPEDIPFFCIAGVREYHDHPGHTGDAWELHRASGAGRLARLLEVIHRYGVEPITGYAVQLVPKVGFESAPPPP
jgi:hypothetical protein